MEEAVKKMGDAIEYARDQYDALLMLMHFCWYHRVE
jgi:hypothetical protein